MSWTGPPFNGQYGLACGWVARNQHQIRSRKKGKESDLALVHVIGYSHQRKAKESRRSKWDGGSVYGYLSFISRSSPYSTYIKAVCARRS
jgi:hypothetical protein